MAETLRNPDTRGGASRHYRRTLVVSMVVAASAAGLLGSGSRPAEWERQLEAAMQREVVLGDLPGAMQQYRGILAQTDVPRPVAARALLQIGGCLEKLGQEKEAYNAYQKTVTEYRDQAAVVSVANKRLEAWTAPRNLRFEEGAPLRVPPGWIAPSLPKDANFVAELRKDGCRSHSGCAVVVAPVNVPGQAGNLMQSFNAVRYRGKTVRLRAWLKLEQLFDLANGILRLPNEQDRGQLWLRVVRSNRSIGFSDNMEDRPVRTSDWTPAEISGDVDDDAQMINFGVMSFGGARVWIDDVTFEVVK